MQGLQISRVLEGPRTRGDDQGQPLFSPKVTQPGGNAGKFLIHADVNELRIHPLLQNRTIRQNAAQAERERTKGCGNGLVS